MNRDKSISAADSTIPLWVLLISLTCAGCATPPRQNVPTFDQVSSFSASGKTALSSPWWTAFDDAQLNQYIEQALQNNFTLASVWERLRAARAVADVQASDLYPDLDGRIQGSAADGEESDRPEQLQLSLEASYEVDLWGEIRSRVRAEEFRAEAAYADYQTAALTLSAELARVWFQFIESTNQLELLQRQIETNQTILDLLIARFGAGQVRRADILRQQQLLESTKEQAIATRSQIEVLSHRLAVLQGRPPQAEIQLPEKELPDLPPLPSTGLPADLVRRRPDVRQAYALLQAADQEVAAAISNQYPRLTITSSLSSAQDSAANLFSNWLASIAGDLIAPLYDAQERAARVDQSQALRQERVWLYQQRVVEAFEEVENALTREEKQAERLESIQEQLVLARQTYAQLQQEYYNGAEDYIGVLTALSDQQRLERQMILARLNLVEFRIALYRALAGVIETNREEAHSETSATETRGVRDGRS